MPPCSPLTCVMFPVLTSMEPNWTSPKASVGTVIELEERLQARTAPANPSALVVGDPNFNGWMPQLGAARREAQEVSAALNAWHSKLGPALVGSAAVTTLIGDAATKPAVIEAMRRSDVVHLATHGERDGVLLSSAKKEEGKLNMAEVQALELHARLVVLSNCNPLLGVLSCEHQAPARTRGGIKTIDDDDVVERVPLPERLARPLSCISRRRHGEQTAEPETRPSIARWLSSETV